MRFETFDIGRPATLSGLGECPCKARAAQNLMGVKEEREALDLAKVATVGMLAFQAIAALSGLGIFLIQAKAYGDKKKTRKTR